MVIVAIISRTAELQSIGQCKSLANGNDYFLINVTSERLTSCWRERPARVNQFKSICKIVWSLLP